NPRARRPATINPQSAIGTGFVSTARIEVCTAIAAPTSRSSRSGTETTLTASTTAANTKPMKLPRMMSVQPRPVVSASDRKAGCERIEQRQQVLAEGEPRQDHAGNRVDQADKEDLARHGPEVGEAFPQCIFEVGRVDPAYDREFRRLARTCDHVKVRHGSPSLGHSGGR